MLYGRGVLGLLGASSGGVEGPPELGSINSWFGRVCWVLRVAHVLVERESSGPPPLRRPCRTRSGGIPFPGLEAPGFGRGPLQGRHPGDGLAR